MCKARLEMGAAGMCLCMHVHARARVSVMCACVRDVYVCKCVLGPSFAQQCTHSVLSLRLSVCGCVCVQTCSLFRAAVHTCSVLSSTVCVCVQGRSFL